MRAGEYPPVPFLIAALACRCPRCGRGRLFDGLLKVAPVCPVCGAEVLRPAGEAMYYCTNAACPAQLQARLEHFAGRTTMEPGSDSQVNCPARIRHVIGEI